MNTWMTGILLGVGVCLAACDEGRVMAASEQSSAPLQKPDARTRMNTRLMKMAAEVRTGNDDFLETARAYGFHVKEGLVLDVQLAPGMPDPTADFEAAGARVLRYAANYDRATLSITSLGVLDALVGMPVVHFISPVFPPVRR